MKNIGSILLLVLLGVAIAWAFEVTSLDQPMQGNCGEGFIAKDETSPFEYDGGQSVCKVIIKAGSQEQENACYGFIFPPSNQSDGCYNVNGLGSNSVSVGGGGTDPDCKEISHVEFYPCLDTATPTSTATRPPLDTPTQTSTSTGTSTSTATFTVTSTDETYTVTPSATITGTPETVTPTGSVTPNRPTDEPTPTEVREPTPTVPGVTETSTGTVPPGTPECTPTRTNVVRLPDAGGGRTGDVDGGAWYIPVAFAVALVVFFLMMRRRGNETNLD